MIQLVKKAFAALVLLLLFMSTIATGCLQGGSTSTSGHGNSPLSSASLRYRTLKLPSGNHTTLYLGEVLQGACPPGQVRVTFTYHSNGTNVTSVSVRGTFNDWKEWHMKKMADGSWILEICLPPGKYQYKFFIDGKWVKDMSKVDPTADSYVADGYGGKNAVKIVRGERGLNLDYDPSNPAYLSVADNRTVIRFKVTPGEISSATLVTSFGEFKMEKQLWWSSGEMWRAEVPVVKPFKYYFRIERKGSDVLLLNNSAEPFFSFDGVDRFPQVQWVSKAVGYQIFPDRFYNGNKSNDVFALQSDELWLNEMSNERPLLSNWSDPITPLNCCHQYFGGDIAGITDKLNYLSSLGVKLIYLNPIFLSGSVHGYDPYDYYRIDPKFGTNQELKEFLKEAHKRGIRVIFDFVPDHSGIGHWAFLDVAARGRASPYWNWYFIKKWPFKLGDGKAYAGWWGIGSLPKLNTMNPAVESYLLGAVMYWLNFGFDGVRVDTPSDLINADQFFSEMRKRVKEKYPNAYLVGEIWTLSPEWVSGDRFDSLMNYALGRNILLPYAKGSIGGEVTMSMLGKYYAAYGENVVAMGFNLVDSHDTSRVLTDLGGGNLGDTPKPDAVKRLKLLSTLLYTLPGMPVTFQGDECGFLGNKNHYDEQRYPLQWDKCNQSLVDHYRKLAKLRESVPALTSS
ncbi:alpha-amylase family glycosyl hydrolase, partial [Thermococcus sp.]|uniref:alpha-amylase family glycosyl hydrolase n=1 Tax=Thermococcus sp. TaxID=35749 RepID=UPI002624D56A